jgi:phospholipid/cholesterol/gamma-HCH transport system substrate-binding protein
MKLTERLFETIIGIGTLIVFAIFFVYILAKSSSVVGGGKYYNLYAKFSDIEGVVVGSAVKLSGITIGEVSQINIDENFMAVATLKVSSKYLIPTDSSLSVSTSGLIGSKYLMVSPGADEETLKNGSYFFKTQSSIGLDGLIKSFATK